MSRYVCRLLSLSLSTLTVCERGFVAHNRCTGIPNHDITFASYSSLNATIGGSSAGVSSSNQMSTLTIMSKGQPISSIARSIAVESFPRLVLATYIVFGCLLPSNHTRLTSRYHPTIPMWLFPSLFTHHIQTFSVSPLTRPTRRFFFGYIHTYPTPPAHHQHTASTSPPHHMHYHRTTTTSPLLHHHRFIITTTPPRLTHYPS